MFIATPKITMFLVTGSNFDTRKNDSLFSLLSYFYKERKGVEMQGSDNPNTISGS